MRALKKFLVASLAFLTIGTPIVEAQMMSNLFVPRNGTDYVMTLPNYDTICNSDESSCFTFSGSGLSPESIILDNVTGSTYDNLEDFINLNASAGIIDSDDFQITDNGDGTVDVTGGDVMIRTSNDENAPLVFATVAGATGLSLTDNDGNYIYVDYNAGTPQIAVTINGASIRANENDQFEIYEVYRTGTDLHITKHMQRNADVASKIQNFLYDTQRVRRAGGEGGLIIGETGTRNITVSAGKVYVKLSPTSISAFDSSGTDTWTAYYNGGNSSVASQTQWDNAQYDNAGTLTALTTNRYAFHDFYIETDGSVVSVYATAQYTSEAEAATAPRPIAPDLLEDHGLYIGRVVFRESGTSALEVNTAFGDAVPNSTSVTDHTLLSNLAWTGSNHTGTASNIAGFDGSGVASYYDLATGLADNTTLATKGYVDDNAGGGGVSTFDCEVSSTGDYTTVGAAIAGGCYNILVSESVTETGDIALGANTIYAYIKQGATVDMSDYQYTTSGSVFLAGNGTIEYSPTVGIAYLFSGTTGTINAKDINVLYSAIGANAYFADGIQQIDGVYFNNTTNLYSGVSFRTDGENYILNSRFTGAGSSDYNKLNSLSGVNVFVQNIVFDGTYSTTSNMLSGDDGMIIDGVKILADQDITIRTENSVNNLVMPYDVGNDISWSVSAPSNTPIAITNCILGGGIGGDMTLANDFITVSNCGNVSGTLEIDDRSRCRIIGNFFANYTISTGSNNILTGNTAGSSGTITISDAGATGNIVTSNQTGVAISDSGTGTVVANNYEY